MNNRHVSKDAISEARRAINDGNEDCIGLERLRRVQYEATTPEKLYRPDGGNCPYEAKFKTRDGQRFCQLHSELWAAQAAAR